MQQDPSLLALTAQPRCTEPSVRGCAVKERGASRLGAVMVQREHLTGTCEVEAALQTLLP